MFSKKVIYISGPITGVEHYRATFEAAEAAIIEKGHIPLTPAVHPKGLTNGQYMRMCFAQMDCADAVLFLPNWKESCGARLERLYCQYIGKPCIDSIDQLAADNSAEEVAEWPSKLQ